jgi:hypothetical protein
MVASPKLDGLATLKRAGRDWDLKNRAVAERDDELVADLANLSYGLADMRND